MSEPAQNTDRELWRERPGDYYADSLHVTEGGGIGINCGGLVFVMPIRAWHALAKAQQPPTPGDAVHPGVRAGAAGAGDLQEPCSVCVGRPLASGRECICGGIGTALAETQGLRERVADLEIALGFWPNIPPQTSKAYAEVSGAGDRLRLWPAASGPSAAGGAP